MASFKGVSQEKDSLREKLWIPVFSRVARFKDNNPFRIKYLCLPGRYCIFIRQLEKLKLINLSNVVACERKEYDYLDIVKYMGNKSCVFCGDISKLIQKDKNFITTFPFDIINLDFYGPSNVLDDLPLPKNLSTIEKITKLQEDHDFHLLLTSNTKDELKGYGQMSKEIRKLNTKKVNSFFEKIGNIKKGEEKDNIKRIFCIVMQVLFIGFNNHFDTTLIQTPYTYRSGNSRMLCFAFHFKWSKLEKGSRVKSDRKEELQRIEKALENILKTGEIKEKIP